jgi:pimeloyl-ACP methyl ester carboxylesterase
VSDLGLWIDVEAAGRVCRAYEPANPSQYAYTVIYLHGVHGGKLEDHRPFVDLLERFGLRAICPMVGPCWWTDRICLQFDEKLTAERYLVDRVMPLIEDRWGASPPRVALLGTSMGGQGALRLAYKYPDVFPVVAAISPAIDFHLKIDEGDAILSRMYRDAEQARQDTATLHIHPLNWPRHQWFCCDPEDSRWHESVERLRMKLYSLGVPHECDLETTAGGHGWTYYENMAEAAMSFVYERLERDRRRIV